MSEYTPEQYLTMVKDNTVHSRMSFNQRMKNLERAKDDTKREVRLKARECKLCYYLRARLAGQAFTDYKCRGCGETKTHSNTAVPNFCDSCSDKFGVCVDCGADLDFRDRTTPEAADEN